MLERVFSFWCHTWELDAAFPFTSFTSLATSFHVLERSELQLDIPTIPGLLDATESSVGNRSAIFDTKLIIGFVFATTLSSSPSFPSCCLFDIILDLSIDLKWLQEETEKLRMLNKRRRWFHSSRIKLPLVHKSTSFFFVSTYLICIVGSKLILSNNQSNATLSFSGHVSHHWTSSFDDDVDHCFVVLKNVMHGFEVRRFCACDNVFHMRQLIILSVSLSLCFVVGVGAFALNLSSRRVSRAGTLFEECKTSITRSQRSSAGIPSMRRPASNEITSGSVELCDTEVCFLHIQLIETKVRLPNIHRILPSPEVDLESSRPPAMSESWNNRITNMAILSVVTCVMNIRDQTSQASVTS